MKKKNNAPTWRTVARDLRKLAADVERMASARDPRPTTTRVLELLGDYGPLSAHGIRRNLACGRPQVYDALRKLSEQGVIEHIDAGWRLVENMSRVVDQTITPSAELQRSSESESQG